ncbi:MAG: hypothetical protein E4G97_01475 [Deltaproteobacteria bacterium]|nr:MAG: hypothetical protein E4G97_01475 [Deltaproteobacteria bacterium]
MRSQNGAMERGCRRIFLLAIAISAAALTAAGCGGDTFQAPANESDARASIVNDVGALAVRVTDYTDDFGVSTTDVPIETQSSVTGYAPVRLARGPSAAAPATVSLRLLAEAVPSSVGGRLLQATSIAVNGNKVVVSYNNAGLPIVGGIDVFEIANGSKAQLKSQVLFNDTKVHSVTLNGNYLFAAEADITDFPARFEVLTLNGTNLTLAGNNRTQLPSFAGTCAFVSPRYVYATSGDNGGLSVYSPDNTARLVNYFPLHDARWVDAANGTVVVSQGTPGGIVVFDEATIGTAAGPTAAFPFPGATVPESKSTVQIVGEKIIVAAGDNGVQILSLRTGKILGHVPLPDNNVLGLPKSVVVTNAVSADARTGGTLLFLSNGEAGVYVAEVDTPFIEDWGETIHDPVIVGKLRFGSLQSVNHVTYHDGLLIVAAGTGGVKIVRVD